VKILRNAVADKTEKCYGQNGESLSEKLTAVVDIMDSRRRGNILNIPVKWHPLILKNN